MRYRRYSAAHPSPPAPPGEAEKPQIPRTAPPPSRTSIASASRQPEAPVFHPATHCAAVRARREMRPGKTQSSHALRATTPRPWESAQPAHATIPRATPAATPRARIPAQAEPLRAAAPDEWYGLAAPAEASYLLRLLRGNQPFQQRIPPPRSLQR